MEAEIFERVVKVKACTTLRKCSVETGRSYGEVWTKEECDVAECVGLAYRNGVITSVPAIQHFIEVKLGRVFEDEIIKIVIAKMEMTHERLLKNQLPYLKDEEYKNLIAHKNRKKGK